MILLFAVLPSLAADPIDDLPESTAPAPAPASEAAPAPAPAAAPTPGPVTQAQIQSAVDAWYGKSVPAAAVCIGRPTLPAPFGKEVVVVGVTKKNAGCRIQGVMIGGVATPTVNGLAAAVPWKDLDATAKLAAAKVWTTQVLLHFDAPVGDALAKAGSKGAVAVTAPFARRTEEFHVNERFTGAFAFDAAGNLTATGGTSTEKWRIDLYQQEVAVQGLTSAAVNAAVTSVGASVTRCVEEKTVADPTFEGATRIAMVVAAGKIEKLGAEEESDAELTRCFGNALYEATWSPTAKGTAVWSFTVVKTKL